MSHAGEGETKIRSRTARAWLGWWDLMRRWHRYEVEGLEHLLVDRARLIVGYHGRPIAHDLCMLQNVVKERLGYLPHPIVHAAFEKSSRAKVAMDELGFVIGDGPSMAAALERGEHVFVTPGGTREGYRSFRDRYRVNWGGRTGYLRLALKYGLEVVPVAAVGTDDAFVGLNNGYELAKRLDLPSSVPSWLGLGLVGVWPLALPFPVKIRQLVGAPMDLLADGPVDAGDREQLLVLHHKVTGAVQGLMDEARGVGG